MIIDLICIESLDTCWSNDGSFCTVAKFACFCGGDGKLNHVASNSHGPNIYVYIYLSNKQSIRVIQTNLSNQIPTLSYQRNVLCRFAITRFDLFDFILKCYHCFSVTRKSSRQQFNISTVCSPHIQWCNVYWSKLLAWGSFWNGYNTNMGWPDTS